MMLLNTLATESQLLQSPSRQDGVPERLETEIRVYGCQLIQSAGILLGLPQRVMATAQVLYQRFWFVSSFKHFSSRDICMGALFLSTKLEESPARLRDLINVFDFLIKRDLDRTRSEPAHNYDSLHTAGTASASRSEVSAYDPQGYFDNEFYEMKDALVVGEMQLLKRLGFEVQVNLPYATMVNYLQLLELADTQIALRPLSQHTSQRAESDPEQDSAPEGHRRTSFAQAAWSFLNDALQTPVYCLMPPHVLACAVIFLTAQTAEPPMALPLEPLPWWKLFDAQLSEMQVVCSHIQRLYRICDGHSDLGRHSELLTKKDVKEWLSSHAATVAYGESRAK